MKKLLDFLWNGCWHDWKLFKEGALTLNGETGGWYCAYQCKKCHRFEKHDTVGKGS